VINIVIAFLLCVLAFIGVKVLNGNLYRSIEWPVIVMLAAMIPIGQALETTGISNNIAMFISGYTEALPVYMIILLILVVTMFVSDIINNAATAIIMAPIAANIASQLGAPVEPFLMAVAVGASCAFLSPIGHQCNTLVMAPGGYKFGDYWRLGLPLEIVIAAISVPMIMYVWF
jgi:di/tricarboxylate transporter